MKKRMVATVIAVALGIALGAADAPAQPAKIGKTTQGNALQTNSGMTLYVYDGDEVDKGQRGSSCNGQCSQQWPPFSAGDGDKAMGDWNIITRKDGGKQWTYKGRPLYTFKSDESAGQTAGNSYEGNSWHIAQP